MGKHISGSGVEICPGLGGSQGILEGNLLVPSHFAICNEHLNWEMNHLENSCLGYCVNFLYVS